MKILVIGATGMVGSRITSEGAARGHDIIAASRKGDANAGPHVTPIALDINDVDALREQAAKVDLVVSAVSPRITGDAVGDARKFTKALIEAVGTTRLIQVGGASSLNAPDGSALIDHAPPEYRAEAQAMLAAHDMLAASDIDWTVQAPALTIAPGERTGKARLGDRTVVMDENGESTISAEDFAVVLLDEAEKPAHRRTIYNAAY
ncbi:NAD(P)-dependent oxidoreductase [Qipengyuania qiaonensis]|uniref:NAD(P)H-binding protein n=1 Tax=Qipengyuania qiaonensis TaxID=2867240 RepID=A0ABS7JAY2_9SPHN|nr:NAD(P)H-binding protein [Qipengyuania qiaonensis]MBX7482999.1 NAD(P)H-binding protein [Qipengyuania qiaonensis]